MFTSIITSRICKCRVFTYGGVKTRHLHQRLYHRFILKRLKRFWERFLFLVFCFLFFFAFGIPIFASDNLIENGSFENNEIWERYGGGSYEITDEKTGKVFGVQSNYSSGIRQRIEIEGNKNYRVSGKIRFTDSSTKGAIIRIAWYKEGNSSQLSTENLEEITSPSEIWQEVSENIFSPAEANIAEIRLLVAKNSGEQAVAYFDDLFFGLLPSPSSSPLKATLKINEAKDEDGKILSAVKIYIDDVYIHHYTPETLNFCDNCQCNGYVGCGFGEHTIKLIKTGYQVWSENKTINPGDHLEINPILILDEDQDDEINNNEENNSLPLSPSPSSFKSFSPKPSFTPSPSSSPQQEATISAQVLGLTINQQSSPSASPQQNTNSVKNFTLFSPLIISLTGILFLIIASFPFLKPKIISFLSKIKKTN